MKIINQKFNKKVLNDINSILSYNNGFWTYADTVFKNDALKYDKYIQEKLKLQLLLKHPKTSILSKKSTKELLLPLTNNKYLLHIDVKNYYGSIKYEQIQNEIEGKITTRDEESRIFKHFYFDKNMGLRRGLSGSPIISEIIGIEIDTLIKKQLYLAHFENYKYARYYDDIFISSNDIVVLKKMERLVTKALVNIGLKNNDSKTRIFLTNNSKILGLRIIQNNITVPKKIKKNLRPKIQKMQNLYRDCKNSSWKEKESIIAVIDSANIVIGSLGYIISNSAQINEKYIRKKEQATAILRESQEKYNDLESKDLFIQGPHIPEIIEL